MLSPSERERILEAVAELVADRGYEATSVAAVLERSGVSEEDFDQIFADKEDAVLGAMNWLLGETMSVVSAAYSPDRSELESALAGVRAILELMAANTSYAYLGFISVRQMGTERMRAVHETGIQMLGMMLERLREYSEIATQPRETARGALGGAEAVVRRELVGGRAEQLPRLLPDLVYGATAPYLGTEGALVLAREARDSLRGTAWEL